MGVEVAARTCFPSVSPTSPSHHHTISSVYASISSSPPPERRRSPFLRAPLSKTRSLDNPPRRTARRHHQQPLISATTLPCFPGGDDEDFIAPITNRESISSFVSPPPFSKHSLRPDEVVGANTTSSMDPIPVSLRTIKKKLWEEDGSTSVKRAFSSMLFIIWELQQQMGHLLFLRDVLHESRMQQRELHDSFVWLFPHIFSCTPALIIISLTLLYSIFKSSLEQPSIMEEQQSSNISAVETSEDAAALMWKGIVDESRRMAGVMIDPEILQGLVSPVRVEMEGEDEHAYLQTELMYMRALSQDPDNTLLLTNFAQFLYLVLHDCNRAESYFNRAVGAALGEAADGEALSRYASFLWVARKDIGAAEETFLEAIAADPGNTYHAANYANFLWNTGGEDTCFPIDDDDDAMGDNGGGACICS